MLLLGGRRTDRLGPYLACATTGLAFVYGLVAFFALRGQAERSTDLHLFSWIPVGGFTVDAGLLYDPLSATFVLLITGVGFLIHVYSLGYMEHDPRRRQFFAYLNLFVAAMLLLVLADSFLGLYVGWEGVGLASYLLISFYFDRNSAATAAKKAFIANRVGDVGLSLAIMVMFATLGTTTFAGVFTRAETLAAGAATAIGLLLLLGACGKSGQFPLHTWLPDAMEGPTPVSALIHAATMVTAGVYLIARSSPIYEVSARPPRWSSASSASITLLIGCIIGCAYDDIKKVLAYSTVSQIGYMFLAVGIPGRRARRDPAPADARLLQGLHVPVGRLGHARHERPGRHAPLRRAAHRHAGHLRLHGRRLPGDHRLPVPVGLLLQGPHHRGGLRPGRRPRLPDGRRRAARPPASRPST